MDFANHRCLNDPKYKYYTQTGPLLSAAATNEWETNQLTNNSVPKW